MGDSGVWTSTQKPILDRNFETDADQLHPKYFAKSAIYVKNMFWHYRASKKVLHSFHGTIVQKDAYLVLKSNFSRKKAVFYYVKITVAFSNYQLCALPQRVKRWSIFGVRWSNLRNNLLTHVHDTRWKDEAKGIWEK